MKKGQVILWVFIVVAILFLSFNNPRNVYATIGNPGRTPRTSTCLGLGGTSGSFYGESGEHYYYFFMFPSQKSTFRIKGMGIFDLYIKDLLGNNLKHETVILTGTASYDFTWDTDYNFGGYFVVKSQTAGLYYSFEWIFEQYVGPFPWNWVPVGSSFDYAYYCSEMRLDGTGAIEGTLSSSDHYYYADWTAGQGIIISITGETGTNFDVYVYDSAHNLIDKAVRLSYPDTVAFETRRSPTYIVVHSSSGSGEYRLEIQRPYLRGYNVTPVYVRPGQSFLVKYQIFSPFSGTIPVGLGCSIRSPSGKEINDLAHDTLVSVSSGTDWYSRLFMLPFNAEDGWYDVWWAIYGKYSPTSGFGVQFNSTWWVNNRLCVDGTPPPPPIPDDGVSGWSNDNTPTFTWSPPSDLSGIEGYYWKVDGGADTWTTSTSVTLSPQSDGTHTFYVKAKDRAGNIGNWGSHTFRIDTTPPPSPIITSSTHSDQNKWYNNNDPVFSWNTPFDTSGIAGYSYVLNQISTTIPDETIDTTDNSKSYLDLSDGIWYFHLRARDNAGNWGPASHYVVKIDRQPPSGSILINDGAEFTNSTSVTLTLTYFDATSGVSQVRYSNDGIWDTELWEKPSIRKTWTLTPGDGLKTVYYQVKDNAGLISTTYFDEIILDTTPPTGSIKINDDAVNTTSSIVTLTLFAWDENDVIQMRFSNDGIIWTPWEPYATIKRWNLSSGYGSKIVYVEFKDRAGITSIYSDTIEYIPEFSSIIILLLLMPTTTILIILLKRKRLK